MVAYVTLRAVPSDCAATDALEADLRATVAAQIGKLARPKRFVFTADLPKTRSGKIMRRLLTGLPQMMGTRSCLSGL